MSELSVPCRRGGRPGAAAEATARPTAMPAAREARPRRRRAAWSASLSRVKVTVTVHWQAIVTVTGPPVRRSQPVRGTVWVTGGRRSGLRVSPSRSA